MLMQRNNPGEAISLLVESASVARAQKSLIQLGRILEVLASAARRQGDPRLAGECDAERTAIIEKIGPEGRGLAWVGGVAGRRRSVARSNTPLSPRELEVAALIAHGLTDRQIGERLIITEGTTGVHVGHILTKLGFHTRAEIASWAIADRVRQLGQPLRRRCAERLQGDAARVHALEQTDCGAEQHG